MDDSREYDLSYAAVLLWQSNEKQAADAELSYGLKGKLYLSKSGWLMLQVPNALARGAFDALGEPGCELPPGDGDGPFNAHISVARPEEIERIGGADRITERGHDFSYTLGPVREVEPAGWSEMSKVWFIEIRSPELEQLRKSYGLSGKPNEDRFNFHVSFAVRRKNVTRSSETTKQLIPISDVVHKPQQFFKDKYHTKTAAAPAFDAWYADRAKKLGLNPNPDAPEHFYDYRAAYDAGAEPDASGHWPSKFKREGHPNLIVDGRDTRTGEPARRSAVIIKGNPARTQPEAYGGLYEALAKKLKAAGYDITFDAGAPHTVPPKADVWIGHSRGADRLRFAGEEKVPLAIAIGSHQKGAINHPGDVVDIAPDAYDKLPLATRRAHNTLHPKQWEQLAQRLQQPTVGDEMLKTAARLPPWVRSAGSGLSRGMAAAGRTMGQGAITIGRAGNRTARYLARVPADESYWSRPVVHPWRTATLHGIPGMPWANRAGLATGVGMLGYGGVKGYNAMNAELEGAAKDMGQHFTDLNAKEIERAAPGIARRALWHAWKPNMFGLRSGETQADRTQRQAVRATSLRALGEGLSTQHRGATSAAIHARNPLTAALTQAQEYGSQALLNAAGPSYKAPWVQVGLMHGSEIPDMPLAQDIVRAGRGQVHLTRDQARRLAAQKQQEAQQRVMQKQQEAIRGLLGNIGSFWPRAQPAAPAAPAREKAGALTMGDHLLKQAAELTALKQIKEHSDRGQYTAKHHALRKLLTEEPQDWDVEEAGKKHRGVRHRKTGFRYHMPSTAIPTVKQANSFYLDAVNQVPLNLTDPVGTLTAIKARGDRGIRETQNTDNLQLEIASRGNPLARTQRLQALLSGRRKPLVHHPLDRVLSQV